MHRFMLLLIHLCAFPLRAAATSTFWGLILLAASQGQHQRDCQILRLHTTTISLLLGCQLPKHIELIVEYLPLSAMELAIYKEF